MRLATADITQQGSPDRSWRKTGVHGFLSDFRVEECGWVIPSLKSPNQSILENSFLAKVSSTDSKLHPPPHILSFTATSSSFPPPSLSFWKAPRL